MPDYEYILFDWDGCIARTLDLWLDAFRIVLRDEGFEPEDQEIAASFGRVEEYFEHLGIADPPRAYARADALGRKELLDVQLYPGSHEVLEYLEARSVQTALITSSSRSNITLVMDKFGIKDLFNVIITRDDVTRQKPHPDQLLEAMARMDGNIERALLIGDSDKDLGAARNAGIDAVLFYPSEHEKFYDIETLMRFAPRFVISDMRELQGILES